MYGAGRDDFLLLYSRTVLWRFISYLSFQASDLHFKIAFLELKSKNQEFNWN